MLFKYIIFNLKPTVSDLTVPNYGKALLLEAQRFVYLSTPLLNYF